jgi:hypothetical protein
MISCMHWSHGRPCGSHTKEKSNTLPTHDTPLEGKLVCLAIDPNPESQESTRA